MKEELTQAIRLSDRERAGNVFEALRAEGETAWDIHSYIFPVVQLVLNPPFKNPHLAKMYAVNREIATYLEEEEQVVLVGMEIAEYARRKKLDIVAKPERLPAIVQFSEVEQALGEGDLADAAAALAGYLERKGAHEFGRRLLLLGSGYLDASLGHSVSCTAFILAEMIRRTDQDPWPALVLLADYFRTGSFTQTPELRSAALTAYDEAYLFELARAVSGTGIVALHHPITLYAIERSRMLFTKPEYDHMLAMWTAMMADKKEDLKPVDALSDSDLQDFSTFFEEFAAHDAGRLLPMVKGATASAQGRKTLCRFVTMAVLHSYDGAYNPHNLTGLGSVMWLTETFPHHSAVVVNGWLQYLDYFFQEIG